MLPLSYNPINTLVERNSATFQNNPKDGLLIALHEPHFILLNIISDSLLSLNFGQNECIYSWGGGEGCKGIHLPTPHLLIPTSSRTGSGDSRMEQVEPWLFQ